MNEDNIPTEQDAPRAQAAPEAAAAGAAAGTSGHYVPSAFASTVSHQQAPAQQASAYPAPGHPAPGHPAPGHQPTEPLHSGAAFGLGDTTPLAPADPLASPASPAASQDSAASKEKKPFGAGKVAALILAAALVGGATGVGGGYLGSSLAAQPAGSAASGPETVTVNNPGSVNEATAIAAEVLPSVVTIQVAGQSESGSGSGVILSDDGYVLTNTHVVTLGGAEANPNIRVTTSDGRIYEATIVGTDPIYDLAVIQLKDAEDLTPIEFADSSKLNVGSTAVAVGAPLGLSNSVTTGIVSALNRSIQIASSAVPDSAQQDAPDEQNEDEGPFQFDIPGLGQQQATETISIAVIQTDAAINPGNSGGALVDSEGKLIGINVAIATAGSQQESGSIGVGFAIPSNVAERIADELIEDGAATHGLLGATVKDAASAADAEVAGALINDLTAGGAAEKGGLRAGDIVTEFNGVPITGATDLTAQVRAAAAGSTAKLTYVRDGREYEIEVTLGELAL